MTIQNAIVLTIVVAAGSFLLRSLWTAFRSKGGCHCGQAAKSGDSTGIKRVPLITPDQIGRPGQSATTEKPTANPK